MRIAGEGLWPLARPSSLLPGRLVVPPRLKPYLPSGYPTAVAFLDETGSIAADRFFGVGCLKLREPSRLLRQLQKLRDRHHWYAELHWVEMTRDSLAVYREVVDLVASAESSFSCFIADPVARFGSPWRAYEKLLGLRSARTA
jgi:hypothetical protein